MGKRKSSKPAPKGKKDTLCAFLGSYPSLEGKLTLSYQLQVLVLPEGKSLRGLSGQEKYHVRETQV
jgi:hypothetical protein